MPRVPRGSTAAVPLTDDEASAGAEAGDWQYDRDWRLGDPPDEVVPEAAAAGRRVPGAAAQGAVLEDDYEDSWRGWRDFGDWHWQSLDWSRPSREEGRDGGKEDVPSWDGREPELAVYLRKIRLWEAYTSTPAEKRGV